MMKCGIYETNITPALGMEMPGYFEVRRADGVREELYSIAAFFESGGSRAVIISNDTIQLPMESCDRARAVIAEKLDTAPENILFCATHTHTGGPVETWGEFVHINAEYIGMLESRMIDAAVMAAAEARKVRLSFASAYEDKLAYYRNYVAPDGTAHTWKYENSTPFGTNDPEVGVLRIDNADGSLYGTIVNYACHCDCVGGTKYSSDYPGEMRRALKRLYGSDFKPVFINGFCGNLNHIDPNGFHREVPEHYKRMGRMLAADAARALEVAVKPFEDETIAGALTVMQMDSRVPDRYHLDLAKKTENNPAANEQERFYAREIRTAEAQGKIKLPCPVQVVRIGEVAVFGMPGEIYVEFGKMLKQRSPIRHNMPAYLSNGAYGYVPIRELVQPGIYEASVWMSDKLTVDAGYLMVDELIRMADRIK